MLPQCENLQYILIEEGEVFGIMDLIPETKEVVIEKEVERMFTVMATENAEVSEAISLRSLGAMHNSRGLHPF